MKKIITLMSALFICLCINAQGEYYDGVYVIKKTSGNRVNVSQRSNINCDKQYYNEVYRQNYDEVVETESSTKDVLVKEYETINYWHKKEIKVNHFYVDANEPNYYNLPNRRISMPQYNPMYDGCSEYSQLQQEWKKWYFFFNLNSDFITNREELGHLINYAKNNPNTVFYIDSYADAETGSEVINLDLSKRRSNSITRILISEGIEKCRLFVNFHGSSKQPYNTNSLNRCVVIKTLN